MMSAFEIRTDVETLRLAKHAATAKLHTQFEADKVLNKWRNHAINTPIARRGKNSDKVIVSLFDESGIWSAPYVHAGYTVIQLDIQNGVDILELDPEMFFDSGIDKIDGLLAACPCTHFANSGARWFKDKDESGITQEAIDLVHQTMGIVEFFEPEIWCIENPMGRIRNLTGIPPATMFFEPHHFGDPYTKKTQLFGEFNTDLPMCNVFPEEGSRIHKLRGDVPEQKKLRSETPEGFAYAFYMANQI